MSMLAEKKRRTQWCLNPMGNFWAKDENKFGQKMLEKMGWSPGMGLGANGQGKTDIIKINVKNDTLGLGSKKEDKKEMWTKQLVDFDCLLSELNGVSKKDEKKPISIPSLEEKSKSSRVRVHYHKFTRGKDVSKYSSKDLNCILPLNQIQEEEKVDSPENNMYAYFGKKAKNPYKQIHSINSEEISQDEILVNEEEEDLQVDISYEENDKRKKKKRKHLELEQKEVLDDSQEPEITEEPMIKKKKKKKKPKLADKKEMDIQHPEEIDEHALNYSKEDENNDTSIIANENECNDVPKKKKKKKKNKQENETIDSS